jgi:hypothetical protein
MMEPFRLVEHKDTLGRLKMITARVRLKDYAVAASGAGTAIVMDQLVNIAEECYGRLLSGVGEGEMGGFEFGFEGNRDAAVLEVPPMTLPQHAVYTAKMFSALVNHSTWRIVSDSP